MKKIKGTENYFVSEEGRVFSNFYGELKELVLVKAFGGYKKVSIRHNGKLKNMLVHRLVAEAFIPNPENKREVNHKNGKKDDNRKVNLEWATRKENQKHRVEVLGHRIKFEHLSNYRDVCLKKVGQYTVGGVLVKEWTSMKEAADNVGISQSGITTCCRGRQKTAKNFIWKYH